MNSQEKLDFKRSLFPVVLFLSTIWLVKIIEVSLDISLVQYGNYPRTLKGAVGIIASPFIHADFQHLTSNSFPILFLGVALFYFYRKIAWQVLLIIYLLSGFWVWLAARDAYHIGASGLVYGLMAFLLLIGFLKKDRPSMAMSFVVLILYGGSMFLGVLPTETGVSWESHLVGAIAGLFCAILFRKSPSHMKPEVSASETHADYEYTYTLKDKSENGTTTFNYQIDLDELRKKDKSPE